MRRQLIVSISIFLISIFFVEAQNQYPKGAYLDFKEIRSHKPSMPFDFKIIKRTKMGIILSGGSDYKVISNSKKIKRSQIKHSISAISTGDTLFLNCFGREIQQGYAIAKPDSNLFFFHAGYRTKEIAFPVFASFLFGGIVGGMIVTIPVALHRLLYVENLKTGEITSLNHSGIKKILAPKPALLKAYKAEKNRKSDEVLMQYFKAATN